MDFNAQTRVAVTARVLVDAEQDWLQVTVEAHGVDPRHLLSMTVHHPERLEELGPVVARLCIELIDVVRESTGTRRRGTTAPPTHEL